MSRCGWAPPPTRTSWHDSLRPWRAGSTRARYTSSGTGGPETPKDLAAHNYLLLDMPEFSNRWRLRDPDGRQTEVSVSGRLVTLQCARPPRVLAQGYWDRGAGSVDRRVGSRRRLAGGPLPRPRGDGGDLRSASDVACPSVAGVSAPQGTRVHRLPARPVPGRVAHLPEIRRAADAPDRRSPSE